MYKLAFNIFVDSLSTTQETQSVSNRKAGQLALYRKVLVSFCDRHMKHTKA